MIWRAGSSPGPAAPAWLGVIVAGLLMAGCGAAPRPTDTSSITPRGSTALAAPSAAAPTIAVSPTMSRVTPSPMELVSTFTGAPDTFSRPDGIGLDQQGDLYVADAGNSRIQKLDGEGHVTPEVG